MLFITIYLTLLFIGANCSGHLPIRGAWIGLEKQNSEMKALLLSVIREMGIATPKQGPSKQEAVMAQNGTTMDISRHKARMVRSQLRDLDLDRKGKAAHKGL